MCHFYKTKIFLKNRKEIISSIYPNNETHKPIEILDKYVCEICNKEYSSEDILINHLKKCQIALNNNMID